MPTLDYHSPRRFNKLEPLTIANIGIVPALCSVGIGLAAYLIATAASPFWRSGEMDAAMFCVLASLNCAFIGWLCVLQTFMRPRGTVAGALALALMSICSMMTLGVIL
jgi:hypothetical protein